MLTIHKFRNIKITASDSLKIHHDKEGPKGRFQDQNSEGGQKIKQSVEMEEVSDAQFIEHDIERHSEEQIREHCEDQDSGDEGVVF